jgi:hypothetical protein
MAVEIIKHDAQESSTLSCPNCGTRVARPESGRTKGKSLLVGIAMGLSGLYLLNPGMGIFDFIPDNIPGIGNIDEGVASAILLGGVRYFGLDWLPFKLPKLK